MLISYLFIIFLHSRASAVGSASNINGKVIAVDALCVGLLMAIALNAVVLAPHSVRLALHAFGYIHIANIPKTTAPIAPNMNNTKSGKSVHANHFFDLYSSLLFAILTNGTAKNNADTAIIKNVIHAFTIISLLFQPLHNRFGNLDSITGGLFWVSVLVCYFHGNLFCEVGSVCVPIAVSEVNFHGDFD